jgi:iron(III) transport system substrate-binding protein
MRLSSLIRLLFLVAGTVLLGGEQVVRAEHHSVEAHSGGEVNLYTHRHYEADETLFEAFTSKTGIEVNIVKAEADELIERLKSEGAGSPADLLITADAGRLERAQQAGLLRPVTSEILQRDIPAHLRESDGHWFGLTARARVIAYAKDRVTPAELSTYEALAERTWKGRLLSRSSSNIYNQSLLASIIAHSGDDAALAWARGVRANMARPPQGSDRDQMRAVAAGLADVAIVNTYYLGLLANSEDPADRQVAQKIGIFFPNQGGRGAHINISGAGVTRHAKNPENAIVLLEFLVATEQQSAFASANFEYPVNPAAEWSPLTTNWGTYKADTLNLGELGTHNAAAVKTFDLAGWE